MYQGHRVYTDEQVEEKRKEIHHSLVSHHKISPNFTSLTPKNLEEVWEMYDRVFFHGEIEEKMKKKKYTMLFKISSPNKKTKIGAWCRPSRSPGSGRCFYTMSFPAGLYLSLFQKKEEREIVNGRVCSDRLMCLQLVMEHELIHILFFLFDRFQRGIDPIHSAHGKLFQCMAHAYFGHTDFRHEMGADPEAMKREDIRVGMFVRFTYTKRGQDDIVVYAQVQQLLPGESRLVKYTRYRVVDGKIQRRL